MSPNGLSSLDSISTHWSSVSYSSIFCLLFLLRNRGCYYLIEDCTIDGSCLCSLTDSDLKEDLKITNAIHRKKLMNCNEGVFYTAHPPFIDECNNSGISIGLKTYSQILKKSPEDFRSN